jgi:TonB family protein
MSDNRQHAEKPLAIGERRLSARAPVTPQAFVKFGGNNYGFVFNISETGLVFAPTGTLTLAVGAVAKMRFLLPESREWIETSGEVAWIAGSQKEAGVRFVDLADETRERIRNWIAHEPSRAQPPHPRFANPEPSRSPAGGAPVGSTEAKPGTFVDNAALSSILADPAKLLRETKTTREKIAPQSAKIAAVAPRPTPSNAHVPERRSSPRRRVLSLEYIDLGSFNGGILLNLSEGGMYVQAVAGLSGDELPQISFRLPDTAYIVKTNARIAWTGESKKDAGIQFINLPAEARLKIREWVAKELPPVENVSALEVPLAPALKKNERLLEMPAPSKKTATLQETPARIPQKQEGDLAPPPSASPDDPAAPKGIELLHLSGPFLQTRFSETPQPNEAAADGADNLDVPRRGWRGIAAMIFVAVLLSFVAGWIVAGPDARKQFFSMFDKQQNNPPEVAQNSAAAPAPAAAAENAPTAPSANDVSQQPVQKTVSAPIVPVTATDKPKLATLNANPQPLPSHANSPDLSAANVSSPPTQKPAPPVARSSVPPVTSGDANRSAARPSQSVTSSANSSSPSAPAQNKPQEIQPTPTQPARAQTPAPVVSLPSAKATPSPATSNASLQPNSANISSPTSNAIPAATQPTVHADAPPAAAKPSASAEVVKGTVSVSASPFPSIRVPPEMKSQISKQGASLQLGQLISRVEPIYPEDAERQRIEGAVKLHVIIDRDGNIQNIDQMSGPPLLEAAAANAVRQWKYKPTSLGGQPVEAGVDVTVVFRLQPARAN